MAEKMRLGLTMAVMVIDYRPSHDFNAISIAFLDSLPLNDNTIKIYLELCKNAIDIAMKSWEDLESITITAMVKPRHIFFCH